MLVKLLGSIFYSKYFEEKKNLTLRSGNLSNLGISPHSHETLDTGDGERWGRRRSCFRPGSMETAVREMTNDPP